MADATVNPIPPGMLPVGVERKDATVCTQGVNPVLMAFLARLGLVHLHLFGTPVIITSGKDAKHAANSKHYKGEAVDVRIMHDKPENVPCLLLIVKVLSYDFPIAFFDETNLPSAGHLHIEIVG